MGVNNVSLILARYSTLDGQPYKVLIRMAVTIHDHSPAPEWFGGTEPLALAIGYPPDEADSAGAKRAVARAIKSLVEAGALKLVRKPSPGKRALYAVRALSMEHLPLTVARSKDKRRSIDAVNARRRRVATHDADATERTTPTVALSSELGPTEEVLTEVRPTVTRPRLRAPLRAIDGSRDPTTRPTHHQPPLLATVEGGRNAGLQLDHVDADTLDTSRADAVGG